MIQKCLLGKGRANRSQSCIYTCCTLCGVACAVQKPAFNFLQHLPVDGGSSPACAQSRSWLPSTIMKGA